MTALRRIVVVLAAGIAAASPYARVALGRQDEPPARLYQPEDVEEPPWLRPRAEAQARRLATAGVFHGFRFRDVVELSGIDFRQVPTDDSGRDYKAIHYDHGNGVAVADVDGDGRLDLYFVNQVGSNRLYRNLGGGRFVDATSPAIALDAVIGVTASFADTDNDGDPDLYVTSVRGGNFLFENDGAGRFRNVTGESGLRYTGHSSAGVFFDYDRDGLVDLFLCNVGVYTTDERGRHGYFVGVLDAFAGHLKPERTERSILYRNVGGNRFVDVTERVGLLDDGWTGDAAPFDVDGDGWIDLYTLDMQGHDRLWINVRGERFEERGRELFPRTPWGTMGVKPFDFDNDGDLDLFLTDMHSDMSEEIGPEREKLKSRMQWDEDFLRSDGRSIFGNAFFRNDGEGRFVEISDAIGVETYWPWGVSVGDLNADGYLDAFVTAGMNYLFRYGINSVLLNEAGERFVDAEFVLGVEPRRGGRTTGPAFVLDASGEDAKHALTMAYRLRGRVEVWGALGSRSSVLFDWDDDGDLDIITNEFNDRPLVLESDLASRRKVHFLAVELVGTASNRGGLGATVTVVTPQARLLQLNDGKSGYLSQSAAPLYFGLGEAERVERIEIAWPSGRRQVVAGPIAVDRLVRIAEQP